MQTSDRLRLHPAFKTLGVTLAAAIGLALGQSSVGCLSGLLCNDYEDEDGDTIEVLIENHRADAVVVDLVGGCAQAIYFEATKSDERYPGESCGTTCGDLLAGDTACPQGCGGFGPMRIEAGGTHREDWNGTLSYDDVLPLDCGSDDLVDHKCDHQVAVGSGEYELTIFEIVDPVCPADASLPDCECPAGQDTCEAEERGGTPIAITKTINGPSGQVVLVID